MQNEFEKQVQKKMEELDLVPSAPVWEKIEEQIRRKTDRRMVSLWVPLLFLLLGGGVWMLYDNQQSNGPRQNHQTAITNSNESKQIENKKQFPPENKIAPDKIQQKASVPFNIEPEKVSTAKGVKPHETSPDDDRTIASSSLPGTKNSSRKMLNINAK